MSETAQFSLIGGPEIFGLSRGFVHSWASYPPMAHAIDTNKDLPFEHSVAPILLHEMNGRMQCAKHRNYTENKKPEGDLE